MTTPLSSDILVNTVTTGNQSPTGVATLTSGVSVVAWYDASSGASVGKFQLVDVDGAKVGAEVTIGPVDTVEIAALTGGGFVVAWAEESETQAPGQGWPKVYVVKAQVFDAGGSARGGVLTLDQGDYRNSPILGVDIRSLEATGLSDGGFAVTWEKSTWDDGGRTSLSVGLGVGSASGALESKTGVSVDSGKAPSASPNPTVVELPGGKILLTWGDADGGFPYSAPRTFQAGQVFDLSGNAIGPAFEFPTRAQGGFAGETGLQMASLPTGDVAFVWKTSAGEVWTQLYSGTALANGNTAAHSAAQLVTSTLGYGEPQIAILPDGRFVVAYGEGDDAMARVYSVSGVAEGPAFKLGTNTAGAQDNPDIAVLPNGALIAVWRDTAGTGADTSGAAVKASLFTLADGQAGTAGADALTGGAGNQLLAGLEGADTLTGGAGADTLSGGAGADHFVLTADGSADRVLDFMRQGGDVFDLRTAGGAQATGGLVIIDQITGQTWWDPDSDAGSAAPISLGFFNGSTFSRDDFAAGFRPDGVRVLTWNGGREDTVFDWSTQKTFATATFDAQGRAEMWHVEYDSGQTGTRWWDTQNTQEFSTRAADYNGKGELLAYGVTYDDGHSQVFQFDVNGDKPWSRLVDLYDALGRQSMQGVVWDDGTAAELHRDTYDVHPWAYYIDNYKDGALLNHTFYKADGTVFVG